MLKLAISPIFLASEYYVERPELDWRKMKDALGKVLKMYNNFVDDHPDAKDNDGNPFLKLAVSMEATAKQIMWLFMQKFSVGQISSGNVLKLTRGYLAESLGKDFRAPAEVTVSRHIERFLKMPYKFLVEKNRSTLGIPGKDVNCISLEIAPSLIFFKSEKHQKSHEMGTEILRLPSTTNYRKNQNAGNAEHVNDVMTQPFFKPTSRPTVAHTPQNAVQNDKRKSEPSSLGSLMGNLFSNFSMNPETPKK